MRAISMGSLGLASLALFAIGCDSSPGNPTGASGGAPALTTGPTCGTSDASDPINDSGGCTPQPLTQAQALLQGPYGSHMLCIGDRQYYLQVNEWGSTAAETIDYGGGNYYFRITKQNGTSSSGAPTGFPSIFIGANSGNTTLGSNMPRLVSSLNSVPTTWNWKDNGAVDGVTDAGTNTYNATYDVWFSTNPAGEPGTSCPSGGFLMVWLHKPAAAEPIGGGAHVFWRHGCRHSRDLGCVDRAEPGLLLGAVHLVRTQGHKSRVLDVIRSQFVHQRCSDESSKYHYGHHVPDEHFYGLRDLVGWRRPRNDQLLRRRQLTGVRGHAVTGAFLQAINSTVPVRNIRELARAELRRRFALDSRRAPV